MKESRTLSLEIRKCAFVFVLFLMNAALAERVAISVSEDGKKLLMNVKTFGTVISVR